MAKLNRSYIKRLEDLILQLDSTFSDLETAKRKGYLARDMPRLHKVADGIRDRRKARVIKKRDGP
jgi:hypothetical protein